MRRRARRRRPSPSDGTAGRRCPAAEIARQIAPGHACPCPPQHRLQEPPIVPGRRTRIGHLAGQQWRNLLPNRAAHHEPSLFQHRPNPAKAELEPRPISRGNPQCQQTLGPVAAFTRNLTVRTRAGSGRRRLGRLVLRPPQELGAVRVGMMRACWSGRLWARSVGGIGRPTRPGVRESVRRGHLRAGPVKVARVVRGRRWRSGAGPQPASA